MRVETLTERVDAYEKKLILEALEFEDWNQTKAAKLLGIKRTTLIEKMKRRGIKPLTASEAREKRRKEEEDYRKEAALNRQLMRIKMGAAPSEPSAKSRAFWGK